MKRYSGTKRSTGPCRAVSPWPSLLPAPCSALLQACLASRVDYPVGVGKGPSKTKTGRLSFGFLSMLIGTQGKAVAL
jgi:hypothetical protein